MVTILDRVVEQLAHSTSPSVLILTMLVAVVTAAVFAREYVNLMIKLRRFRSDGQGEQPPVTPVQPDLRSAKDVVTWNFSLLEKYYDQTLGEYRLNSRATVAVASLGFAVILIGVGFAFAGSVTVGTLSAIAGLISEAAAYLFFRQNQLMVAQVQEFHKKLVSTQYILTAVSLADSLSDEMRQREVTRIITNLLFLSNELHGSHSEHLFVAASKTNLVAPSAPNT